MSPRTNPRANNTEHRKMAKGEIVAGFIAPHPPHLVYGEKSATK